MNSPFRVIAGQLVFRYEGAGVNYFYEIRHVDKVSLELVPQSGTTFPTLTCNRLGADANSTASPTPTALNGQGKSGKPK